jgi:hypothetical protein
VGDDAFFSASWSWSASWGDFVFPAAKKALVAAKKTAAARRPKAKRPTDGDEDEDADADFEAPKKKKLRARDGEYEEKPHAEKGRRTSDEATSCPCPNVGGQAGCGRFRTAGVQR